MKEVFKPELFLKKTLPAGFWNKKILSNNFDLKQEQLRAIITSTTLSERELKSTASKVIDIYEKKAQDLKKEGIKSFKKDAVHGEKLLKNRIEGLVLYNEVQNIKEEREGQYYRWLPSSSEEPDPEHQLLYGKIFKIGEGDKDGNMPAERYGCKCGMEFLEAAKPKERELIKDDEGRIGIKNFDVLEEREKALKISFGAYSGWIPKKAINKEGFIKKDFSKILDVEIELRKQQKESKDLMEKREKILGKFKIWRPDNSTKERIYFEDGSFAERIWEYKREGGGVNDLDAKRYGDEKNTVSEWVAEKGEALKKIKDIKRLFKKTRF